MSITIGNYKFDGPYTDTDNLENKSGVYAILSSDNGKYNVIDIGESSDVRDRVENHDRKECWFRNCSGEIEIAVLYTPNQQQSGRMQIEQELRKKFNPPCGER